MPVDGGAYLWSKLFSDSIDQYGNGVAVDAAGNVFVTGYFIGTIDCESGSLTSAGDYDALVAKFDSAGKPLWSKRFGDKNPDYGDGVAIDAAGNLIATGTFSGTVDFGNGPLTSAVGSSGDIFIAKFDTDGQSLWSKRFGGMGYNLSNGVAVDAAGNVVITGTFTGTVDLGEGPLSSAGDYDIFVAKFDAAGNPLWSKRFGDVGADQGWGIAVDAAGNVIIIGKFGGTVDFGDGSVTSVMGSRDIFVAKFNTAGNPLWSKRFGDLYDDEGRGIAVDAAQNVLITGDFSGTVDFGNGSHTSAGSSDIFMVKFNAGGTPLWSKRFGDAGVQRGRGIAVDLAGRVILTGSFGGTVDFGSKLLTSLGKEDVFVAKFDATGAPLWSKGFGDMAYQFGSSIASDGAGNVLVTGQSKGTIDFGGGPLTSTGYYNIFLAKLAP